MHTFYLASDSSWAFIMLLAASRHDWNWFLTGCGLASVVWNFFEMYNIFMAITVERQEIWGDYHRGEVSVGAAILNVALPRRPMTTRPATLWRSC